MREPQVYIQLIFGALTSPRQKIQIWGLRSGGSKKNYTYTSWTCETHKRVSHCQKWSRKCYEISVLGLTSDKNISIYIYTRILLFYVTCETQDKSIPLAIDPPYNY